MALTAQQYIGMRALFRSALAANSPLYLNPSDGEVLSFFNQLATEASGAAALTTSQQAAVGYAFRGLLSGNFAGVANPSDQNVLDFWTQLSTDSSGAAALAVPRYVTLKQALLGVVSRNYPGVGNPSLQNLLGYFNAVVATFNGAFSALFTSPYQFMQADKGLTYGSTPKATAGNTSATVMTLAGSTPATPVPVLVKATNTATVGSGATFNIYYDGVGTTAAMTGVALTGTPTALTGAGAGLTLAASVASSVSNDTWKATAAANADQSGNTLPYSQGTAGLQPVVTVGANGHIGLAFDGVDDFYTSAFANVAGMQLWMVCKQLAWASFGTLVGAGDTLNHMVVLQDGGTPNLEGYNGTILGTAPLSIGTVGRIAIVYNSASSSVKIGSNSVANGDTGATAGGSSRCMGCDRASATPANPSNVEIFAVGYMPAQSFSTPDANASSYWGAAI